LEKRKKQSEMISRQHTEKHSATSIGLLSIPVIVAALGYFVDIYDLLLFSIIREKSLRGIGANLLTGGELIINSQMTGLLLGGIIWGVLGDKKGRLSVLFGSILLYSLANIANGFVQDVNQYAVARFIAGIGLAGELGAGITLVSELISTEKRGIATSIVAGIGLTGAIAAYIIAHSFEWLSTGSGAVSEWAKNLVNTNWDWRFCYILGGVLGFLLLIMRVSVFESGMYSTMRHEKIKKGNVLLFFSNGKRFKTYLLSILIGLPCWYVIGTLFTFSKEFGECFHLSGPVDSGKSVMFAYIFISIGDMLIGIISNYLKSRKKALYLFYAITIIGIILFYMQNGGSPSTMYMICMLLGFGTGFWALFVTMATEHFGTNLRATATTTVPNFVRGASILMITFSHVTQPYFGFVVAREITGVIVMVISIIAVLLTTETFGKDLNFLESD
jgi:MFS transporter, putative metabolite:H+ symporter